MKPGTYSAQVSGVGGSTGIAVIEVAMAAIFAGLGVPMNIAVVSVLTYRLISFWLPTAIGIPIAITLQSHNRR